MSRVNAVTEVILVFKPELCAQEEKGSMQGLSPREAIGCAWEDAHCPG